MAEEGGKGMWISKKRWEALEKRVASLEVQVLGQQKTDRFALKEILRELKKINMDVKLIHMSQKPIALNNGTQKTIWKEDKFLENENNQSPCKSKDCVELQWEILMELKDISTTLTQISGEKPIFFECRPTESEKQAKWDEENNHVKRACEHYGISDEEQRKGFLLFKTRDELFRLLYGVNAMQLQTSSKRFSATIHYDAEWEDWAITIDEYDTNQEGKV